MKIKIGYYKNNENVEEIKQQLYADVHYKAFNSDTIWFEWFKKQIGIEEPDTLEVV